jgi:FkbM family methyltransferase
MVIDYFYLKNKWNIKSKKIIHVGAHYGQELSFYLNDIDIEEIVFFEPNQESFNQLTKNIALANSSNIKRILAHPVGLGSAEQEMDFYVASNGQSSSVLKPQLHTEQYRDITFNRVEKIQIKTLDFFNLNGFEFINIDVQGYELEVLKGAKNTLNSLKYIYTEINNAPLYEGCVMIDQLDSFLSEFKFKRKDTNWCGGTWGDAIYIKG